MQKNERPYQTFALISFGFALVAVGFKIFGDLNATSSETARMNDLREVGNRQAAGACLELNLPHILTVGTPIQLPKGKSPTSCFRNASTRQYAYAGYLNGQLQIIRVFTSTEVKKGAT